MNNKVLVKLYLLELDTSYDVFIPVNEIIWKIKKLLIKSVSDLSNITFNSALSCELLNMNNGKVYANNDIVIQTDIRNGAELVLLFRTNAWRG